MLATRNRGNALSLECERPYLVLEYFSTEYGRSLSVVAISTTTSGGSNASPATKYSLLATGAVVDHVTIFASPITNPAPTVITTNPFILTFFR